MATFPPNSDEVPEHYFHNFSSFHPQGTHFVLADGSVRLLSESIDMQVYAALSTRAKQDLVVE
jgi:hypothetical protein